MDFLKTLNLFCWLSLGVLLGSARNLNKLELELLSEAIGNRREDLRTPQIFIIEQMPSLTKISEINAENSSQETASTTAIAAALAFIEGNKFKEVEKLEKINEKSLNLTEKAEQNEQNNYQPQLEKNCVQLQHSHNYLENEQKDLNNPQATSTQAEAIAPQFDNESHEMDADAPVISYHTANKTIETLDSENTILKLKTHFETPDIRGLASEAFISKNNKNNSQEFIDSKRITKSESEAKENFRILEIPPVENDEILKRKALAAKTSNWPHLGQLKTTFVSIEPSKQAVFNVEENTEKFYKIKQNEEENLAKDLRKHSENFKEVFTTETIAYEPATEVNYKNQSEIESNQNLEQKFLENLTEPTENKIKILEENFTKETEAKINTETATTENFITDRPLINSTITGLTATKAEATLKLNFSELATATSDSFVSQTTASPANRVTTSIKQIMPTTSTASTTLTPLATTPPPVKYPVWYPPYPVVPFLNNFVKNPLNYSTNYHIQTSFGLRIFAMPSSWTQSFRNYFGLSHLTETRPPLHDITRDMQLMATNTISNKTVKSNTTASAGFPKLNMNKTEASSPQVLQVFFPFKYLLPKQVATVTDANKNEKKVPAAVNAHKQVDNKILQATSDHKKDQLNFKGDGNPFLMFNLELTKPIGRFIKTILENFKLLTKK